MSDGLKVYDAMRAFADSWGMLFMLLMFCGVIVVVLWPGRRDSLREQAEIPFRYDDAPARDADEEERR